MKEIVRVGLENELDLILANKRMMKLAELCGLSITLQTTLATAVSEISRCALSMSNNTSIKLGITTLPSNKKQISAVVCNTIESCVDTEAIGFAKRLIEEVQVIKRDGSFYDIQLNHDLKFSALITEEKIESFIEYFKHEPSLSPYDEIKKKNMLLLEFSDKLKESESQYRALADTLPLMMFLASPEGEIIYANAWLRDYFGPSLPSILPFPGQGFIHPEDYASMSKNWDKAFKSKGSLQVQGRLKHNESGAYLWHLISIVPVKNESNAVIQWTGFLVDINAQKIVEEALKDNAELKAAQKNLVEYQKQLDEKISALNVSNHELEQFAYITCHDLQEPLRKIATFSFLLGEKLPDLDPESRSYFSKIISSSDHMKHQIRDVLEWSRITSAKGEFVPVDLNTIIECVKSDFQFLIQEKKAVIQTSPLPFVKGVRLQMVQLFSNLISNALKFCNTTPFIKVSSRDLSPKEMQQIEVLDISKRYAEVTVSDNGIGFQQAYAEQIFRIFQRLNGQGEYNGTGIGLAICKKIVENHRGLISATGNPGRGATFTIILPASH